MMSQNRQEEKDRRRAENDYKVNLKTEIMIEALYDKLNAVLARQSALEKHLHSEDDGDHSEKNAKPMDRVYGKIAKILQKTGSAL